MFESFRRERAIRRALHAIARQRVVSVLTRSPPNEEWFDIAVRTSHIRGWVEVLHEAVPTGVLQGTGASPILPEIRLRTVYRLTEGGWAVIHRSHAWIIATFLIALLSLVAGVASVVLTLTAKPSTEAVATPKAIVRFQPY